MDHIESELIPQNMIRIARIVLPETKWLMAVQT
jgi:hypothetical protein